MKRSSEDKEKERRSNRERIAQKRAKMTEEEKQKLKEKDRERKALARKQKIKEGKKVHQSKGIHVLSLEELEYERIASAVRMRKLRKKRTGKEHLLDKMKAQKGMRILKEEGRVKVYRERESRGSDRMTLWRKFSLNNAEGKLVLAKRNPEMAKKLEMEEEMKRIEAKREREKREERRRAKIEKRKKVERWWYLGV